MKTEIGFRSGNRIVVNFEPDKVREAIVNTIKEGKYASSNWYAGDTLLLNVNEIEYAREVV